jgi:hypothetical protein
MACVRFKQEAQDIFGDADELLDEFRARPRFGQQQALPSDEEELDAEDLGDDEDARMERLHAIVSSRNSCKQPHDACCCSPSC